jgi:DNA primase
MDCSIYINHLRYNLDEIDNKLKITQQQQQEQIRQKRQQRQTQQQPQRTTNAKSIQTATKTATLTTASNNIHITCLIMSIDMVKRDIATALVEHENEVLLEERYKNPIAGMYRQHHTYLLYNRTDQRNTNQSLSNPTMNDNFISTDKNQDPDLANDHEYEYEYDDVDSATIH